MGLPPPLSRAAEKKEAIQGFDFSQVNDAAASQGWQPVSDRKLRVGLVGHGYCKFASTFSFQHHPNVDVAAVSDLVPDRCAAMAKAIGCAKTYPSLVEMLKDPKIEVVFLATDAPSHAQNSIDALNAGKHVGVAVPAVFGSLEDADRLLETVKRSGLKYMMFETSCFHQDVYVDLHAMRILHRSGALGKIVYAEGEYYHYMAEPLPGYRDWRVGLPPQWYPTHSNAYYNGVNDESFTEVSCMGLPSAVPHLQAANNRYKNPFGTEVALFRGKGGGMARMAVSWDTPGHDGVRGRVRGQKGSFFGNYKGLVKELPNLKRPPLPPSMMTSHHGGSHGYLTDEFVTAVLTNRKPLVDIVAALNMSVSGIVAHQSALRDGELMKIPQYKL